MTSAIDQRTPPSRRRRSAAGAATLTMLLQLLLWVLAPTSAHAHAHLLMSSPAADAVVETAPTQVQLLFSGTAVAPAGSIQVFAPDQSRVDVGAPRPAKGTKFVQAIRATQPGTYGVAYRVSSEDGHVITGTFVFSIGTASAAGDDGAAAASRDAAHVPRGLQMAFSTARFVELLALLVAAGSGVFASLVVPGWRPRLLVAALVTLLAAYGAGYVLNAAIVRGTGIANALSGDALQATADTPFGLSLEIRAAVAVVALAPALLLTFGPQLSRAARWATAVVFVGLAASLSITGHAVTTEPTWLRMPLDMVHVTAAAIWMGGLVQLAFMAPFATAHVESIVRFSRTAFACVLVLLATGAYATFAELGLHPAELFESTYGRLILAKLVLYAGTIPLAANNMQVFVPQVRRRPEDAPRMLRQYVWREFALLVAVIALTVWLIATPQP